MSRFFIAIVLCTLLYACKPGVPKNIIQPAKMETVLYDIHVVDGYATTFNIIAPDSLLKTISPYYKGVYKKHGIDSAIYNQSLAYYYKHPEVMKLMYDHITEKLSKARDKATKAEAKATPVKVPVKVEEQPKVVKVNEAIKKPIKAKKTIRKTIKAKATIKKTVSAKAAIKPDSIIKPVQ